MVASAGTILKILDSSDVRGVINFIINLFVGIKKYVFNWKFINKRTASKQNIEE